MMKTNFNPWGKVQGLDLDTNENDRWLYYIIENHFVSIEVDTFEGNTCVEKNEDGWQHKITFELLNHEWLNGFKCGVGITWT
ncbi:hypothetical protein ACFQH1_04120 [Lactiplantibacillus daoliensis]|uniref:Uncharacterized protein n=2 Tax=Lactiplantibacillus daoliensis TaxID=2559916 RepID=A0ABW1UG27_9LACO